ncbi:hypothetical protein ACFIQG_21975, partial [Comamonas odontotermitis]|uniref:hypothetical protein n=1 Tax=Comamonas odontotermitis TaxID=379895 RepID=UPI00366A5FAE
NSLMAQTGGWGEIKPCAKLWLVRGMGFCRGDYLYCKFISKRHTQRSSKIDAPHLKCLEPHY